MENQLREEMRVAIVGHVDHGKSTIIGRLLADTGALPEGKLEQVKEKCRRNSKPFEYAFLLDALKDEQAQGITIDVARCFFKSGHRNYLILDSPGHVEFIKNMVTGAAQADAAILVIDAHEGIQANSIRHGYMLSLLGIQHVIVVINKMDLVGYSSIVYEEIKKEYTAFLNKIEVSPLAFIPVSGRGGDNITVRSQKMSWYRGDAVLGCLDTMPAVPLPTEMNFRMPIQGVYKFTQDGDQRRIVAGTVLSGKLKPGDEVVFYPAGKRSLVSEIEAFKGDYLEAKAGYATGFTLKEQIYVKRGDLVAIAHEKKPQVSTRMRAKVFWLGRDPLKKDKKYIFRLGTAKTTAKIEEIVYTMDVSNFERIENAQKVEKYWAAECIIKTDKTVAFDLAAESLSTGRFVLVDHYDIAGGGIVQEALSDGQSELRENNSRKNERWFKSGIGPVKRSERYNQKPALILITGAKESNRKEMAKVLEQKLFEDGKFVYYLSMNNLQYGIGADIKHKKDDREEYLRRLAEAAHLMSIFSRGDQAFIEFGTYAMHISMILVPLIGVPIILSGYYQAIGQPKQAMLLTLARNAFFLIPALLILPQFYQLFGVLVATPVADFLAFIPAVICYFAEARKLKKLATLSALESIA